MGSVRLWMFEFLPKGFFSHLIVRQLQQQTLGHPLMIELGFKDALLLRGHDLEMVLHIVPLHLKPSNQNVLSVQVCVLKR